MTSARARYLALFAVTWPLAVPVAAGLVCRAAGPPWPRDGDLAVAAVGGGLLAAPALIIVAFRLLPAAWPDGPRQLLALPAAVPLALLQAWVGLMVFMVIVPGWIE